MENPSLYRTAIEVIPITFQMNGKEHLLDDILSLSAIMKDSPGYGIDGVTVAIEEEREAV